MHPIKTALCSFGMSGWVFHAPFIGVHPGFSFYAVWERSKQLAKQKFPDVITYTSYEDMLADNKVELVVVNTPNYTHFDYAKKAFKLFDIKNYKAMPEEKKGIDRLNNIMSCANWLHLRT